MSPREPTPLPVVSAEIHRKRTSSTGFELPQIRRVHFLPTASTEHKLRGETRLEFLREELERKAAVRAKVHRGDILPCKGVDFVVLDCDPSEGALGESTDYYFEGSALVGLSKIQFTAYRRGLSSDELVLARLISPLFSGTQGPYGKEAVTQTRVFHTGHRFCSGEAHVVVDATDPPGAPGVVTPLTQVFANAAKEPLLKRVQIQLLGGGPRVGVFAKYLKSFVHQNVESLLIPDETFTHDGAEFQVVLCDPEQGGLLTSSTEVYCE